MNKEIIKELFDEISTGTGLSYSGDRTISRSEAQSILDYITNLQQKVEQLENIRKEAIKATKDVKQFVYDELVDRNVSGATETHCKIMDLLNILNKGSDV